MERTWCVLTATFTSKKGFGEEVIDWLLNLWNEWELFTSEYLWPGTDGCGDDISLTLFIWNQRILELISFKMLVPVTLTVGLNALFQRNSYLVLELSLLSSVQTVVIKCALFFFRKQQFLFLGWHLKRYAMFWQITTQVFTLFKLKCNLSRNNHFPSKTLLVNTFPYSCV